MATADIYPDVGTGAVTSDAYLENAGSNLQTLTTDSTCTSGMGITTNSTTYGNLQCYCFEYGGIHYLFRIIMSFDTSILFPGASISAATLYFWIQNKYAVDYIALLGCTPTDPAGFVLTDWGQFGSTLLSSAKYISNISTGGYNGFTLNANGKNFIDDNGVTTFGFKLSNTDISYNNLASGAEVGILGRSADTYFPSGAPFLRVTYTPGTPPVTSTGFIPFFF